MRDKKLDGISDIRNESDRNGMRVVIELKKDANPQVVLNNLYKQTALQSSVSIIMLALVDNQMQPKILSLRQILDEYITFQEDLIVRRTRYDLKKAQERAHLLRGLLIAQDNIDEVISLIRSRYDDAKEALMERFGLDEVQAQAILDMRLKALQGLDREKLQNEFDELQEKIAWFQRVLSDEGMVRSILKEELTAIRDKFGDERRTEIQDVEDEIDIEDLIEEEQCVYTISHNGYIKRTPAVEYKAQGRGGKGVRGMATRDEDYVQDVFTASTHDFILFFTNTGRVYIKKGYTIPEAGRAAKGTNIVNIIPVESGERVSAMLRGRGMEEDAYIVFVTRNGTVKRMQQSELKNIRRSGIRALELNEGDELINVIKTNGSDSILVATHDGMAIRFPETDARPMGRTAVGVRAIRLREGDYCVAAVRGDEGEDILTVTENGYGKRTPISEYGLQGRGGMGLKNYNVTDKTGPIAGAVRVSGEEDILLISNDGTIIRMAADAVSQLGRATQGVRLMRLAEGVQVIAMAKTDKDEEAAEE